MAGNFLFLQPAPAYTYFLLDLLTFCGPLIFSFSGRLGRFYRYWPRVLPGLLITAAVFLIWDVQMTTCGVWGFNREYLIGQKLFGLPFEEWLFFIVVPYACLFIYYQVQRILPARPASQQSRVSGLLIVAAAILFSSLLSRGLYTKTVLLATGFALLLSWPMLDAGNFRNFGISYIISLIPMAFMNGLLTCLPVVWYDNSQNLGIRIGSIPVEDFLYSASLLLTNISFYEFFSSRYKSKSSWQQDHAI